MSDTRIRPGRLSDDAALTALDRATWSALHAVQPRPAPGAPFFGLSHWPQEYLVAETDGRLIAAVSARDGRAIADPFTRSAEAVGLLRRRARQLGDAPRAHRRPALLLRHA
jgi:hypothetical protein